MGTRIGPAKWRFMSFNDWLLVIAVTIMFVTIAALAVRDAAHATSNLRQIGSAAVASIAALLGFGFLLTITPSAEIVNNQLCVFSLTGSRIIPSETIKEITVRHRASKPGHATVMVRRIKGRQNCLIVFLPTEVALDFADQLSQATGAPVVESDEGSAQ